MFDFYKNYISLNLKDYKNIGIDLEIGKILLAFTIGLLIATVFISIERNMMTALIKKLSRHEATDENTAKTLSELGFTGFSGFVCRYLLKSSGRLKRLIKRVGEPEYTYEEYVALTSKKKKPAKTANGQKSVTEEDGKNNLLNEKIDFATARFYLADKKSNETMNIMEAKNSSLLNTVLFCVLIVAVYVCLTLVLPEILTLINNSVK